MKVLVFGGAGYIGAHAVIRLLDAGHSVCIFDNFSTGEILNVDRRALVFKGDILSDIDLEKIFKNHRFDAVMHFCGLKSSSDSMLDPSIYSKVNIIGTLKVLEVMLKNKVRNFIFSSSSAVYGKTKSQIIDEDHKLSPENYYGFTKLEVERILKWYTKITDLNFISLRYFNAAGYDLDNGIKVPEKNSQNLIPKIMNVLTGKEKKLKIFGSDYDTKDGTCVRDFIHVNDIAFAHLEALEYLRYNQSPLFLNIATGSGHTVLEVVKCFEKLSLKNVDYEFVARRVGDSSVVVSKTKYKNFPLNWKPVHSSLDNIISSVLKMHKM